MALEYEKSGWDKDQTLNIIHSPSINDSAFQQWPRFSFWMFESFLGQELFIKRCEKTTTEIDTQKNKISVGWYSKEDMKSVLKWNVTLKLDYLWSFVGFKLVHNMFFHPDIFPILALFPIPRKKIEGAVKVCEQDADNLTRWDFLGYLKIKIGGPWYQQNNPCARLPVYHTCIHSWKIFLHPTSNRNCKYGGDTEYWVETGETGEKGQEKTHKKERKEVVEDLWFGFVVFVFQEFVLKFVPTKVPNI